MKKIHLIAVAVFFFSAVSCRKEERQFISLPTFQELAFDSLATSWDEAIPLGNGMLGALVWRNGDQLRLSLDRADLWDLRPMPNLEGPEWKYRWVYEQWLKDDYAPVQELFDRPYDESPAPSKIPAGALEFDISKLGPVESVRLFLDKAVCEVKWKSGARLLAFVHASAPAGLYRFEGLSEEIELRVIPPPYVQEEDSGEDNVVSGQDLRRLGYPKGTRTEGDRTTTYRQEGWGGFAYEINTRWQYDKGALEGAWSVSSEFPDWEKRPAAADAVQAAFATGFSKAWKDHAGWWDAYWAKSSITVPDTVLERQWYLEMYKFGSAARRGAPPISLQAVWTADNGRLPPWKGDFHHDLNTQLSYWPAYSGNHLEEEAGFLDWLWARRETFQRYTRDYYEAGGLNVPGVTTLEGSPMGGWIQYSFGPTVSAWLAHHFYLHWRYSMDRQFLEERAYPWLRDVAVFLDEISVRDEAGRRKLPISSSPEIFDNSRRAWFGQTTNFDLALIRWTYEKAAELAAELDKIEEADKWSAISAEWPGYAIDTSDGFVFAPGTPYHDSHRHFSHLMAWHPLGLIDWAKGEADRQIIRSTLANLERHGSDWWTGYSFSWLANLKARAFDGEGAAQALRTFAACFCLPNSFHVNGDQCGAGHSKFTYRPFTLEGNFAFAAGLQEMLMQSHSGVIRVFPAVPDSWKTASFRQLRAEGAFLVSARREEGRLMEVDIFSEKGGRVKLFNSFAEKRFETKAPHKVIGEVIVLETAPGERVVVRGRRGGLDIG